MKIKLFSSLILVLFMFTNCEKPIVEPNPENTKVSYFIGKLFNQPASYMVGTNNFESRSSIWTSGSESYAVLGLGTTNQTTNDIELLVQSKTISGNISYEEFKDLFSVGNKSADGNFLGYHVILRQNGQTYTSVGSTQPVDFLKVTRIEQVDNDPANFTVRYKVEFQLNCNLYGYAAPHELAGKIENSQLIAFYDLKW